MAITNTTDWQRVNDGDTTQLELPDMSHLVGVKIRWRGAEVRKTAVRWDSYSGTETDEPQSKIVTEPLPPVPSGYDFYRHTLRGVGYRHDEPGWIAICRQWPDEDGTDWTCESRDDVWSFSASFSTGTNFVGEEASVSIDVYDDMDWKAEFRTVGERFIDSENPAVTIDGNTTQHTGELDDGEVTGWYDITGDIDPDIIDDLHHSVSQSEEVDYQIEYTYQPLLEAPQREAPPQGSQTEERQPWFEFKLVENEDNDSTEYHARIRLSLVYDLDPLEFEAESKDDQTNWEYYDEGAKEWQNFPSVGVSPDTLVRWKPPIDLDLFEIHFWRTTSHDSWSYGHENSTSRNVEIVPTVEGLYNLGIGEPGEEEFIEAFNISASETSNGELGVITFEVLNEDGDMYESIDYGERIFLGVNDELGNTERFEGIVREKNPSGKFLTIEAITGDGILGERLIDTNYDTKQDIGEIVEDIIDNYCSPLTSNNVDIDTGFERTLDARDMRPIEVLEKFRREYGIYYFVDPDWDLHFYKSDAIDDGDFIQIRYGD